MGEKDLAEKYLESYNDVFADILNVLLFDGEKRIRPSELSESVTETQYKADGKPHEQRRDIAKLWKHDKTKIVLVGLENQTKTDKDMVFRVIGYDGAYYKAQLEQKKKIRYPIVTVVLYFGMRKWRKARSISERVRIPNEFAPYVPDYKINVFEIAYLSDEQVNCFQSDFRIVADYFVQKRRNKGYKPPKIAIQHVDAFLQMMAALTHDKRFEIEYGEQEGEEITMCEVIDKIEELGIQKGISQGIQKGEERNNTLNQYLIQQNRMDDLIRATTDRAFREQLYKEFRL